MTRFAMKNGFFLVLLLGIWGLALGQKNIDSQFNSWWMFSGNHRLDDQWSVHTEYQWRRHDGVADWQQSLLRFGIDRRLKGNAMVTAGYAWIESFPYGAQPIAATFTEHRIWQQLILDQRAGRFYFQHRYRLEQRFLENPLAPEGDPQYRFRQRARYRAFVAIPLNRRTMEDQTLFLAAYEEVFLGFGKGIARNVLDQNRLYFALGWRFNPNVNLQLGYLNHLVIKGDGLNLERNHTLQTGLTWNLDFRDNP